MPSKFNIGHKFLDLIFKEQRNELRERSCDSQRKTPKLPTLTVGDRATRADDELAHIPSIPTPAKLKSALTKVDAACSKIPLNGARIRWTLELLLVYAHDIATSR
ncbi:hypothetical protein N7516_010980 [Penicillium verrucosum]|uniref:uncharacterized protein n=1 Tax=Penicillium verrucosum TaxID=60171 RepID=UPI002545AB66|nr:uncharacterized protein N7516_010980 [Penicillium verrucosum]KAJ5920122.1 hypothetical protein N7516_010980 [Penicillium verrucosum]